MGRKFWKYLGIRAFLFKFSVPRKESPWFRPGGFAGHACRRGNGSQGPDPFLTWIYG
ncbi:hypothetical protein HMPREF3039_01737 [Akkermansia sp. KLE1798]|nr:hypothetical protein HMPREF3039_01737 [Akkermansia sp. KLE1798]KZA05556.1 hypothetical protein HMPREF1326_00731 [Akkermansia sp. KLE1605]